MQNTTCEYCEDWGKECDLCSVDRPDECIKKIPIDRESIGELFVAAFSEGSLY